MSSVRPAGGKRSLKLLPSETEFLGRLVERLIQRVYFVGLEHKKAYYPTRRDEEAVNPDRTRLR